MTDYVSGAEVLADARLRLSGLQSSTGLLICEGRDDLRLFSRVCGRIERIIPAGAKWKVLDAAARTDLDEQQRIIFVVDCDYDVPVGDLEGGAGHVVITRCAAVESDLVDLGVVKALVLELVPAAASSDAELSETTRVVESRAQALAEAQGRLRYVSRLQNLGLTFDPSRLGRYRADHSDEVDMERLVHNVANNSSYSGDRDELLRQTTAVAGGGLRLCHGHDLIEALKTVLHRDFGVPSRRLETTEELMRSNATREVLEKWEVVRRIRVWEEVTGSELLMRNEKA